AHAPTADGEGGCRLAPSRPGPRVRAAGGRGVPSRPDTLGRPLGTDGRRGLLRGRRTRGGRKGNAPAAGPDEDLSVAGFPRCPPEHGRPPEGGAPLPRRVEGVGGNRP